MATKKPIKYDPAMCDQMIELGKQGSSQKMIWSVLGISKNTADSWRKKHLEFAEALDLALVHSQAHWERIMLANVDNKQFNTRMVEVAVRGQFQSDYRETKDTKVELKADLNIDFNKSITDLLAKLKEAD